MSTGIKMLPSALQNVSIANEFAPGFLSSVSSNIIKDPVVVLRDEIVSKFSREDSSLNRLFRGGASFVDADLEIDISDKTKAKGDMAFVTFMLSRYHKEYRKNGTAAKFAVTVGNSNAINFYCMKNYTYGGDDSFTTDNDMILASILGLNSVVGCLRKAGLAGMHPLSRTAVSEEGIDSLSEYLYENIEFSNRFGINAENGKNVAVKLYNTACARKCHQFTDKTKFFIPELAAAQLIMGVMSSKSQSPALIDITNRNLSKLSRASGTLRKSLIMDFMDFCKPPGSQYDATELFQAYKNKAKQRIQADYPATVTALTGYTLPSKIPQMQEKQQGTKKAGGSKARAQKKGSVDYDIMIEKAKRDVERLLQEKNGNQSITAQVSSGSADEVEPEDSQFAPE